MLKTIIKENSYKDSVVLMLLTNDIALLEGVNKVSIMMATPANKDIFAQAGLLTEEVEKAAADDIAIVMDIDDEKLVDTVLQAVDEFLNRSESAGQASTVQKVKNWEQALKSDPEANLAVFSIPGIYAADEADTALDLGLNVFMFSDNVALEDEVRLKKKAQEKELLFMGPDCGTGIISGVPIAFTNKVHEGVIGVVGASGTGIQEVTTIIDKYGQGVSSAIGTGGRDLNKAVGGITMLESIRHLQAQNNTKVILVVSKPPEKSVQEKVMNYLRSLDKPVVALFLGAKPEYHEKNIYHAYTLEEAALAAVAYAENRDPHEIVLNRAKLDAIDSLAGKGIKGLYSGGTLASEAAMLIEEALSFEKAKEKAEGYMLKHDGFEVVDLGDDVYTQGRPHPMIDPNIRIEMIKKLARDPKTGVILLDVVLGYGSHPDMAGALAPAIAEAFEIAKEDKRELKIVATVCGTTSDPQNLKEQESILEDLGVFVAESNAHAVLSALQYLDKNVEYSEIPVQEIVSEKIVEEELSPAIVKLISQKPHVINVGLQSFSDNLADAGVTAVQFDWRPLAGGKQEMIKALRFLDAYRFEE